MKIGIVGLGYVGLPLAVAFGRAGNEVIGVDVDRARVDRINDGRSDIEDVPDSTLAALGPRLQATADYADLADREAIVICVPTPLSDSREPDLTYLLDSARAVASILRRGQLVVLESTTYPGTTRERLAPILEETGLRVGSDFYLAFSPERIDPGRIDHTIKTTPKLLGGLDDQSSERAQALYSEICDEVVVLSSPESAELAKLLENIFRSVNIALVNELSQLCERLDIDVWEVIDAAATKPFGFMRFDPGPGMGGHCLPIDPFYLAFTARHHDFYPEFIELAGKVNQSQPDYCAQRIVRALNGIGKPVKGSRITILGVSYKSGIGDIRESPALKIMAALTTLGAHVVYHDPYVQELPQLQLRSVKLEQALASSDLAAIVTAHPNVDYAAVVSQVPLTVDFRNVTSGMVDRDDVVRL